MRQFKISFSNNAESKCEIVFPSFHSVENCQMGLGGGGTTFLRENYYQHSEFPRNSLRDIAPPLEYPMICRHLSHSKVLIAHNGYETSDAFIYIGSHNLSSSAWGIFEQNATQLKISNYEIGVVFLTLPVAERKQLIKRLPFAFPAPNYPSNSAPWFISLLSS